MIPVKSSNVQAIGYDATTKTLTVHFHNGGRYTFADVPAHEHAALMKAESIGRHFNKNIQGKYQSVKVK